MRRSKDGRYWTLVSIKRNLQSQMMIQGRNRVVKLKLEMWCEVPLGELAAAKFKEALERSDLRLL